MTWPDSEYTETVANYLRRLAAANPGDEELARHARFGDELARLNRERPLDLDLLRSLVHQMEEDRGSGASWGTGMQEVYVSAKALVRRPS